MRIYFFFFVSGSLKWKYQTGGSLNSAPVVGPHGTIYVGSCDYFLYAISPDGEMISSRAVSSAFMFFLMLCQAQFSDSRLAISRIV